MKGLASLDKIQLKQDFLYEMELFHDPVMVREIREILALQPGQVFVDGTLGLAGHSLRFLEDISPNGTLVGFDWDESMLQEAERRLVSRVAEPGRELTGNRFEFVNADFREMGTRLKGLGLEANGILLDQGLNSAQIEDPSRGIAFKTEGPLDMRMSRSKGEPASALLNRLSPLEIEKILFDLGDERWAKAIAKKIVERRKISPLRTTTDLVDAILEAVPPGARDKRIHPATRSFQAIRIAVNGELDELEQAIEDAAHCLAPNGVLAVLSYHSGEDRAVKTVFRELAEEGFTELFKKPAVAQADEIARNPRSRSAKLRAIRRTVDDQ